MRAKLRTWMGSWQVWVTIGCLVYLGLLYRHGPFIAALWPWGINVDVGLLLLALLFVGLLFSDTLVRYILVPFLTRLQGKKIDDRTAKAKEKFADSLMNISTAVFSAVVIGLFVFPFTLLIQTMVRGIDPVDALVSWWQSAGSSWMRPPWLSGWHKGLLFVLCWLPLSVGQLFRRRALDLYDELPPSAPAVAPTAQGINEQPRIPVEGQTTHTSATGGSRHRRRPRAK
jgi:hypothetical protein